MTPRLVEVAPGVLVATSRFMATNTVIVEHGGEALVVDPGVHEDELAATAAELRERALRPVAGFATHAHWDHVLWHRDLGDATRYASPTTAKRCIDLRDDIADLATVTTVVDEVLLAQVVAAEAIPWTGPDAVFVTHDAHEPGHTALHLPERRVLVAGDMTSDIDVPLLEPDRNAAAALAAYHEGLDAIASIGEIDVVITGHGQVCDHATWLARIDADRRYLDALAAGTPSHDPRLREQWLINADRAMRSSLTKPTWRAWADSLPEPDAAATEAIVEHLAGFLDGRRGIVAAYSALPGEIDIAPLLVERADIALPRIAGDSVTWHLADGPLERHRFGMLQPLATAPFVDPGRFHTVLVPGRAFDRHGIRVGRGGGHYDRLVPALDPASAVVGVTTDARVLRRVPTEAHDAPMTHLATETGVRAVGA